MPKSSTKAARATRGSPRKQTADMRCLQCPNLPLRSECPHSPEGRLFLEHHAVSKEKTPRAPQRCSKCPDRPLRVQCVHTAAGREFVRQQEIRTSLTASMPAAVLTNPSASLSGNQLPIHEALSTQNPPHVTPPNPSLVLDFAQPSPTNGAGAETPNTVQAEEHNIPTHRTHLIPIDPFLSAPQSDVPTPFAFPPPSSGIPAPFVFLPMDSDISTTSPTPQGSSSSMQFMTSTPSSSISSLPSVIKAKTKYQRPTKSNPKFGYIGRAMRGTQEFQILRRHELPSPSKDSATASKDFLEGIHRVLEKAEDVSAKTGCWLFVGAQHPGATGGTIHYSSLRLVRDAPDDAEDLVNSYNTLMSSLLRARHAHALEASKKLEEEVQKNAKLASEVSALKDVIKEYSTRLGL